MTKARLVLVHGRAQQGKSEVALIEEWMAPMRAVLGERASCLDQVEIRAPFYGDRLIELLAAIGEPAPGDIIVRGPELYDDDRAFRHFLGQHLEELRKREGVTDAQLINDAAIQSIERGPQNWPWVLAIIRALDKIPGIDGDVIERALRDVWIYLERHSIRKTIDAIVGPAFDTDLPVICVAHSLGTIIAYHILSSRNTGRIPKLVTLGSPLGLEISRRALAPIRHPQIVGGWYNARDRRDVVALYPLNSKYFPIDPAVANFDDVRNRTSNAHGISGYLSNPDVGEQIYRALWDLS
jgi:hypothetical protein